MKFVNWERKGNFKYFPLIVFEPKLETNLNYNLLWFYLQVLHAARTLAQYPSSKIARENLDLFADAWEAQINDLSVLVKEVNDFCQGKTDRLVYMSLPRPGVGAIHFTHMIGLTVQKCIFIEY